ncbi:MAG: hypothetical protein ACRERD_25155 [Candidatus Binatia bacterium]
MDRVIEYEGEVLPDGNLSVPQEIRQRLAATPRAAVHITIQILAAPRTPALTPVEDAWDAFCQLGQSSDAGHLPDASVRHDEYLYGKKR